jgi:CRP-like cAMP-binding protein
MKSTHSHIGGAIDALLAERTHLQARIAKVDEALATMRELFHLPAAERPARTARAKAPKAGTNGHGKISEDAIRAALRNGPLSPRDLATQLGITPGNLRYTAAKLERSGVLVGTGSTTNRLLALSGRKEVP